jgi:hypothetical protein
MLNKKNSHISFVFTHDTAMATLIGHAKFLTRINHLVKNQLTPSLQPHCRVANYRENTLYLHADSPAWATRLRFFLPELISHLKHINEFKGLKDIQIHQAKITTPREKKQKPKNLRISKDTADQLNCLADSVTNQKFASALRRLAKKTG